jgi:hypothetical protein
MVKFIKRNLICMFLTATIFPAALSFSGCSNSGGDEKSDKDIPLSSLHLNISVTKNGEEVPYFLSGTTEVNGKLTVNNVELNETVVVNIKESEAENAKVFLNNFSVQQKQIVGQTAKKAPSFTHSTAGSVNLTVLVVTAGAEGGSSSTGVTITNKPESTTYNSVQYNPGVFKGDVYQFFTEVLTPAGMDDALVWELIPRKVTVEEVEEDELITEGTHIDQYGNLTIAADETASGATVKVYLALDNSYSDSIDVNFYLAEITGVTINNKPFSLAVALESSLQLDAAIATTFGASNSLDWSISGATDTNTVISQTGELTLGENETATSITVRAQSVFDPTKSDSTAVAIDHRTQFAENSEIITVGGVKYELVKFETVGESNLIFTSGGSPKGLKADVLVVAGGGAAGCSGSNVRPAGGGGAGGYIYVTDYPIPSAVETIPVKVGNGGQIANNVEGYGNNSNNSTGQGESGEDSYFNNANGTCEAKVDGITSTIPVKLLSHGGGGGGNGNGNGPGNYWLDSSGNEIGGPAQNGGSGGGGGCAISNAGGLSTSVFPEKGFSGGTGWPASGNKKPAAGGGGAGSVGTQSTGGQGLSNSITGAAVTYAAGGGFPPGFDNGGGNTRGVDGPANTGNGGSVNGTFYYVKGGSGIVVVRWALPNVN